MIAVLLAAEAVPVDASSNAVAVSLVTVLAALVALAIPVALVVTGVMVARQVRRQGEQLEGLEARLAQLEGSAPPAATASHTR